MKRVYLRVVFVTCLILALVIPFAAGAAEKIVVKLSDTEVLNSNAFKAYKYMGDIVSKETNNQIVFEYYPQAVLSAGKVQTMMEQCQMGSLEAAALSSIQATSYLPELQAISLPLLFDNFEQAYKTCKSPAAKDLLAAYDKIGMVGVSAWTRSLRQFLHTKKFLLTPTDFQNQKIRVPEIKLFVAFFKNLGAVVTPMTWGEVFTALQLGSIDGLEQGTDNIYTEKLYEVVKYLTLCDYTGDWKMIAFSKKFWSKLTPPQQKIITDAAEKGQDYKYKLDKESIENDMGRLKEKGMFIQEMTLQQKELFKPFTKKVWTEFEPIIGKDLMNKMLKSVNKL